MLQCSMYITEISNIFITSKHDILLYEYILTLLFYQKLRNNYSLQMIIMYILEQKTAIYLRVEAKLLVSRYFFPLGKCDID